MTQTGTWRMCSCPSRAVANSRSAFMDVSGRSSVRKGDYRSIRGYTYDFRGGLQPNVDAGKLHVKHTGKKRIQPVRTGNREQIAPGRNTGKISRRNFSRYETPALLRHFLDLKRRMHLKVTEISIIFLFKKKKGRLFITHFEIYKMFGCLNVWKKKLSSSSLAIWTIRRWSRDNKKNLLKIFISFITWWLHSRLIALIWNS